MEEKILSLLLDMQLDIKKIQADQKEMKEDQQEMKKEIAEIKADQQEMKKEMAEMKEEQQGMKKEIIAMKKEQKVIKKDQKEMKKEQKSMRELQEMTINRLSNLQEEVRINKINIAKILEVQNETLEFLKDTMNKNELEHNEFRTRLTELERKAI